MFKFADSVSMRLVQIFQEAIMTGVDGADLLRQVTLAPDVNSPNVLTLTPEYQKQVTEGHQRMVAEAFTRSNSKESTSKKEVECYKGGLINPVNVFKIGD